VEFINDSNGEVINFYRVLKHRFADLKREIDATLHSEFQQKQAKTIYTHPDGHDEVKRAWALWVLSHQSVYSVMTGGWSWDKRRNRAARLQGVKQHLTIEYAERLERTSVFCGDALDVISKTDGEDTFHYIDPPYFNANMGHYGGYTLGDFESLLSLLTNVNGKFMLSSYPSDVLNNYAKEAGWHTQELDLSRSAGSSGGRKTEVLTMNYDYNQVTSQALRQAA
jgi:DNA adenine methylase